MQIGNSGLKVNYSVRFKMKKILVFLALFLGSPLVSHADQTVSNLPALSPLTDPDLVYCISYPFNGNSSRKCTFQTVKQSIFSAVSGDITIGGTGVATISNGAVSGSKLASGISAAKIGDGSVNNEEFQDLDGVTSNIQDQLDALSSGFLTSISVASANGFNGSASGGSTPIVTIGTSATGVLKGSAGALVTATSGTDYAPATSGNAILKGNNAGGFASTTPGVDYAPATSGTSILAGNGGGGFTNTTAGVDYLTPTGNGSGLTNLTAANITLGGTAQINITGASALTGTINGQIAQGTNVTITGSGTSGSPYVINASGGTATMNFANSDPATETSANNTETTLYSYTIPANTLANDGDVYKAFHSVQLVNSGGTATRELKIKLDGNTLFDTGPFLVTGTDTVQIDMQITRDSSTTEKFALNLQSAGFGFNSVLQLGSSAPDWSTPITYELTGQAGGTGFADGDITQWFANSIIQILP